MFVPAHGRAASPWITSDEALQLVPAQHGDLSWSVVVVGCGVCRQVNQTVGSVVGGHRCGVLPLGNHSLMNGVTIRGEGSDPAGGGTEALVELVGQWQRLSRWRQAEARRLVGSVAGMLDGRTEVPLDEWFELFPESVGASVDALCRYVGSPLPENPKLRALEVAQLEFARNPRYAIGNDERPSSLGDEVDAVESFEDLEPHEQARALEAIGQRIAAVLAGRREATVWDAIWDVAEDEFSGNGDTWCNEFQDGVLSEMAEPLLASGTNVGLGYSEHLSLLNFGPGPCFAAFEPGEGEDWQFVERVDPTDIESLRVLALDAYCFGRSGGGDPSQPVDWASVYPPLRLEDIWDGRPPPTGNY